MKVVYAESTKESQSSDCRERHTELPLRPGKEGLKSELKCGERRQDHLTERAVQTPEFFSQGCHKIRLEFPPQLLWSLHLILSPLVPTVTAIFVSQGGCTNNLA